jgi:hypothetical protein
MNQGSRETQFLSAPPQGGFEPKVQIFCAAAKVGFEESDWLATEASTRT